MKSIETESGNHRMCRVKMKRGALEIAPLPEEGGDHEGISEYP